jgi:Zn-dependent metalloprotease
MRGARPGARLPAITKKDAIRRALEDLGRGPRLRAQMKYYELIYPARGGFRTVYKIVLPVSRPLGNWVYLVDPFTGAILNSYNTMRFARGRGRVYLTSPVEDPSFTVVALDRLRGQGELRGAHVTVINEDFPEARSENGSFLYAPDDTHFDEVMAYYHVDRAGAFFRKLDPSLERMMAAEGCIRAFVHAGDAMDNAYYDPSTDGIYFGDGGGAERLNDLAKEAAVVYHEYTHAVLGCVNPHLKGTEADALHEGYADYYGCSLTDDPQIGEWVVASAGKPYLRDLTNRKRYPRDLEGEAHADGEIWGGGCWDLRCSLGAEKADRLVYESMHFLPEFARFQDAALGIVQADESMYSGRDRERIAEVLKERLFMNDL